MAVHQIRETPPVTSGLAWLCPDPERYRWSPGVYDILGLPVGSVAASAALFLRFVHPQDQHVSDLLEGQGAGTAGETFFRVISRDGTTKLVSLIGLEPEGCDCPRLLCLFEHRSQIDWRFPGEGASGGAALHGNRAPALWTLHQESGEFTLSSPARQVLGLGPGERFGLKSLLRQVGEEERPRVAAAFEVGDSASVTSRFRRVEDGAERRLQFTFFNNEVLDQLGQRGAVEDVTESWERESRLRRAERLLSTCIDTAFEGMLLMDRDGRVTALNGEARRLLGDVTTGSILWDSVPSLLADPLWQDVRRVSETGRATSDERFVPSCGHWLRYTVRPAEDGILLVVRDRDEVYDLRSQFHEFTSRCDAAFKLGQVGVWDYDETSDVIWFAQSAKALVGSRTMTLDDLLARVGPEDAELLRRARHDALAEGRSFDLVFTLLGPDGKAQRVRARGGLRRGGLANGRRLAGMLVMMPGEDRPADGHSSSRDAGPHTLTGAQVRAARGALRWSVRELAARSSVSVATINRFEADSRPVATRDSSVAAIHDVLRDRGITFFTDAGGRPAISLDDAGGP